MALNIFYSNSHVVLPYSIYFHTSNKTLLFLLILFDKYQFQKNCSCFYSFTIVVDFNNNISNNIWSFRKKPNINFLFKSLYLVSWWRIAGSNRWPPACKAGALPAELIPQKFLSLFSLLCVVQIVTYSSTFPLFSPWLKKKSSEMFSDKFFWDQLYLKRLRSLL